MIKRLLIGLFITLGVIFPQTFISQVGVGPAPYCMPNYFSTPCNQPFPSNTPGNGVNDFIHSYNTFGGIVNIANNASGCNAQILGTMQNYRLWGCQHYLKTQPGQFITSNFQSGITYAQGATVFIDWNQDGVYNAAAFTGAVPGGERMTSTAGVPPAAVVSPMPGWTVPTVPNGVYRMRVRCAYFTTGNFIQPCSSYTFGETEEYFVYINTNPSTMTVNITSNSPVCIGGLVQINTNVTLGPGSGTCTANTYTYSWTGPMSFTSNVMNPSFTATNVLQSGVYTLNITPGNGCGCGSTNTVQIWVNPNPSTSITNNGPVCQGSVLNFSNNVNGSGTMTYNWTGPNGFTSNTPSLSFASAQSSMTGVYNFTVISSFPANGGQCVATSSSSVAVVLVAQVIATPSFTQCQGTNINLTANVNGATSYTWQGPNSYTSSLTNPTLTSVTPSISGNYTVTAYFASNQTTLVCSSTAVSNVSIVPQNQVTVTLPQNVCQGSNSVIITATANANPTYIWNGPNQINLQQQSLTFNNIQPFVSGNYSVIAMWSIGTISCSTSALTTLSVVPMSPIGVVPQITVCDGDAAVLTATAPGATSYTWTGPNNFNVTQPNTQFQNLNPTWSGIYTITASFTNGQLTCYNTNQTQLSVNPKITFSLNPISTLCYGQGLTVNGPNGATSYSWTGPNFNSNTQNLFIQNATSLNAGNYFLTVDLNGCKTYGQTKVVVQDPIVWKNFPSNKLYCKGDTYTVNVEAGSGSGNYAYVWNPPIASMTGSVQSGIAGGTTFYNVLVYDIACPFYTISNQFWINVNSAPVPNLSLESKACEPKCQIFNSKTGSQSSSVWYQINGEIFLGDSTQICLLAGNYTIATVVTGTNGCSEKFPLNYVLEVYPKPNADFNWTPEIVNTVSQNQVQFSQINTANCVTWEWEFTKDDLSELQSPIKVYETPGKYPVTLVSTNKWGCKDTITKIVKVEDESLLWVPLAFSPNGDGTNDIFRPKILGIKSYELSIFDRWGRSIYSGQEWNGQFKGQLCQEGVYVYLIMAVGNDGKKHEKTGHVTLLK